MGFRFCFGFAMLLTACGMDSFTPGQGDGGPGDDGGGGVTGGGEDGGSEAAAPPPGCDITKLPTDDACVIDDAVGIFVSSSLGTATGDGSRAHPMASFAGAITTAKAANKRVYACAETYVEQVQLAEGISVFGYFTCSAGWTVGATHAALKPTASPVATASNIAAATRVEAVDFIAPDFTGQSQSSIALIASGSGGLTIKNATIHAGTGGSGSAGTSGIQLTDSGSAKDGSASWEDGVCTAMYCFINLKLANPAGGTNACVGAPGYAGGAGGSGGTGGEYQALGSPFADWNAITNAAAGNPVTPTAQTAEGGGVGLAGSNGAAGANGSNGTSGGAIGVISVTGYTTSDGTGATDGAPGQGGGGSGGVALSNTDYNALSYVGDDGWGEPGPGGGAGGCPGLSGSSGKGGGASIAIVAAQSALTLDTVTIESSSGGAGGNAGAPSEPTVGGSGGVGAHHTYGGGVGGSGGLAGVSGNGGGGPSIAIAYQGTQPTMLASTATPGAGGSGVAVRTVNGQVIPASPKGVAQASYSF
jgi:hypothetical protein